MDESSGACGPYATTAWTYRKSGWMGVIPLGRPGGGYQKGPVPVGRTGWAGVDPSGPDVQAWIDGPEGALNIGLRLPRDIYVLDVDAHGGKPALASLAELTERAGEPLPLTWSSTSRPGTGSRHMWFRAVLPPGRVWSDHPGPGLDSLHYGHRYAMVWPSLNPDAEFAQVTWWDTVGQEQDKPPCPTDLAELPAAWVEVLSKLGEPLEGAAAGQAETAEVIRAFRPGEPCPIVATAIGDELARIALADSGGALHAPGPLYALVSLGMEGHAGVADALRAHRDAYVDARVRQRGDAAGAAEADWWRQVRGAVGKHLPPDVTECDCGREPGGWAVPEDWTASTSAGHLGHDRDMIDMSPLDATLSSPEAQAAITREYWRRLIGKLADERVADTMHARAWRPPDILGTLADELAIPDEEATWRIRGLLGSGHNAILIAGRKAGKTTLINDVVRCLVDGSDVLGRFTVSPLASGESVAVLNYEVDARQYRGWLRETGIEHPERVHLLHLRGKALPLVNDRVRAWLAMWLRERAVRVLVLDPYSRAYLGSIENGNDEAQVSRFLDSIDVLKAESGVTEVIMPVHTPKGGESAIGSQRLEAWPDVMWVLTRDEVTKGRYLRAEGRDVEVDEERLLYDLKTRRSVLGGWDRRTGQNKAWAEQLVNYVRMNPGMTQTAIKNALSWSGQTMTRALSAAGGRVEGQIGPRASVRYFLKGATCAPEPIASVLDGVSAGLLEDLVNVDDEDQF